jgi:thymidine kinase
MAERMRQHATNATLEVVCGPMFAGKTTMLLRRVTEARAAGMAVQIVRPAMDHRSAADAIQTHGGERMQGISVASAQQVSGAVGEVQLVVIDEAHFFGAALAGACEALLARGVSVIAAGVDIDHFGRPFEPFPALFAMAHAVHRLQGTCARCGQPSTHTQRLVPGGARIVVGGAEAYEPRCEACFVPSAAD